MGGARKALIIIGGILLTASIGIAGFGYLLTKDAGDFDPSDDAMWGGDSGDTPHQLSDFSTTGSLYYKVWTEDDGKIPQYSMVDSSGKEIFIPCDADCAVDNGFREIGKFLIPQNDTQTYTVTITGDGNAYVMEPLEGALDFLGGWMSICIGIGGGLCGLLFLLIGLMKKDNVVVAVVEGTDPALAGQVVQQVAEQQSNQ
jgi:hypothetical protein